jgi:hypothetical protein
LSYRLRRVLEDVRHDHARFDVHHPNTETVYLVRKRFTETLECPLGRRVRDLVRCRDETRDRRDVHDCAGAAFAHAWQYRLDAAHGAEVVGFEHLPVFGFGRQFERRRTADAGVVDQHIHRSDFRERAIARLLRRDVEFDHLDR